MSPTPPPRRSPSRPPAGRDLDEEPHTGQHPATRKYTRHIATITALWSVGGAFVAVVVGTLALYKWTVGEMRSVARAEREAAELREARQEVRRANPYVMAPPSLPKDGGQ